MATPTASEKIYAHSPEALFLAKISSAPKWLIQYDVSCLDVLNGRRVLN
jgi:hypothetical protein